MEKTYHVSYWVGLDKSSGESVEATSIQEATSVVLNRRGISEDQVIYVHCKNSSYKSTEAIGRGVPTLNP